MMSAYHQLSRPNTQNSKPSIILQMNLKMNTMKKYNKLFIDIYVVLPASCARLELPGCTKEEFEYWRLLLSLRMMRKMGYIEMENLCLRACGGHWIVYTAGLDTLATSNINTFYTHNKLLNQVSM